MGISLIVYCFIVSSLFILTSQNQLSIARSIHRPHDLTNEDVKYIAGLSNLTHLEEVFDHLFVPRVVGTSNHKKVRKYIVTELKKLGWTTEIDAFKDLTPTFGTLTFSNIVATLNPNAKRFLVLACHYDSKYFSEFEFIGATDSAVPCAMMLNLAYVMKQDLDSTKNNNNLSLKLIFFDGEEAFENWGPNDSIYGAKHLAAKWHQSTKFIDPEWVTELERIDLIVLLDLLGTRNPKFYCFFEDTQKWYLRISDAEERLASMRLLENYVFRKNTYFNKLYSYAAIEDDHIPFSEKSVPVVHVIPTPFPSEWHTAGDNRSILDIPTIENLNRIFRIFVAEYLHLFVN